jgi:hypothetical protein
MRFELFLVPLGAGGRLFNGTKLRLRVLAPTMLFAGKASIAGR